MMGGARTAEVGQLAEASRSPAPREATAGEVRAGEMLGSHRILRKLGAGGMGAVYLAEHALIGRKVAIKILLPEVSHNDEIVQRFFNEARIASALDHPGIIQVFDFGYRADGRAFIVMEYLDGESLGARLERRGRLPLDESLRIAHQCTGALDMAHRRGVVHRDIKPDNIFMVPDPLVEGGERAKLLDFGIAKLTGPERHVGSMTRAGVIMGTPVYMAPEQCSGAADVDHRADIYALGCVLFHLLCGRPPFAGPGSGDIMAAHLCAPAPAPSAFVPGIPPAVDAIVARCLAKLPDERFSSMAELDAAITATAAAIPSQVAAASAPTMTPPGLAPFASRPPSAPGMPTPITTLGGATGQRQSVHQPRRRVRKALIAAIVIAAGAAAGLALLIGERQAPPGAPDSASVAAGAPAGTNESPARSTPRAAPERAPASSISAAAPAPEITVRIESVPPGASVFLPGASEPVGVTPYEYRTAPRAEQLTVRLALDGYQVAEAAFDLGQSRVVTAVLNEIAPDAREPDGQASERSRGEDRLRRKPRPKQPDLLDYR
jgi:serine/threonine protein kinase